MGPVTRCGVVTGDDLTTLLVAVKDASALTPWTSGGTQDHPDPPTPAPAENWY